MLALDLFTDSMVFFCYSLWIILVINSCPQMHTKLVFLP